MYTCYFLNELWQSLRKRDKDYIATIAIKKKKESVGEGYHEKIEFTVLNNQGFNNNNNKKQ